MGAILVLHNIWFRLSVKVKNDEIFTASVQCINKENFEMSLYFRISHQHNFRIIVLKMFPFPLF